MGLRSVMFEVDNADEALFRLRDLGAERVVCAENPHGGRSHSAVAGQPGLSTSRSPTPMNTTPNSTSTAIGNSRSAMP